MTEVRECASVHIATEEAIRRKKAHERHEKAKYKERPREAQPRVAETTIAKRADRRYVPYVARKEVENKGVPRMQASPALPIFTIPLRRLLDDHTTRSMDAPR